MTIESESSEIEMNEMIETHVEVREIKKSNYKKIPGVMMCSLSRISLWILVITIFSLLPTLAFYYLGYLPKVEWDNNSIQSNCTILDHVIKQISASCFDGWINISNMFENITYSVTLQTKVVSCDFEFIKYKMNLEYPIGSNITCYFISEFPNDIRLNLYNNYTFEFVWFIIFVILGGIISIALIFAEITSIIVCPYPCGFHDNTLNEN